MRAKIVGVKGTALVGSLRSSDGKRPELRVFLDREPAGRAEISPAAGPSGTELQFRYMLPADRIARTLDIRIPEADISILDQPVDLSPHYGFRLLSFLLDGLIVRGEFSISVKLGRFIFVRLLQNGKPGSGIYAKRLDRTDTADVYTYQFEAPLDIIAQVDQEYRISALIGGRLELPSDSQLQITPHQIGFVGYVDNAVGDTIGGWVVNLRDVTRRVAVHLVADDEIVSTAVASSFRADVHGAGFGDGKAGFSFKIPKRYRTRTTQNRQFGVVLAGTRTHLINSPIKPQPTATLIGFFEGVQGTIATGWACDLTHPARKLQIELVCDGHVIGADTARHFRADVETSGVSIAKCGFRIDLGGEFSRWIGRDIFARVLDPDMILAGSPQRVSENPVVRQFLSRSSRLTPRVLARFKRMVNYLTRGHDVSIVMTVYNTRATWLEEALSSVRSQWCDRWELICVNDGSTDSHVADILARHAAAEHRIKVLSTPKNEGIASATNRGIRAAHSDYVAFMDHDDYLEPDAIYHLIRAIQQTDADLLYSDEVLTYEDINSMMEVRARPAFSYDYYLSHPYFVHMLCVRVILAQRLGGWNESMEISADVDFVLRALEVARTVAHVPSVIYRWRTHGSSAGHAKQGQVMAATKGAIQRHFRRCHCPARVDDGVWFNQFSIDWPDDKDGRILIVVPTRDKPELLRRCIGSIERTAASVDYRLAIVDHESSDREARAYLDKCARRHIVMPYKGPFNFARINNLAVRRYGHDADYILFLNNDVEALETGWLQRLRSLAHRPGVGAVGPLLHYGDKRVQHAGVIIGFNKAADHVMKLREVFIENGTRRNLGYNCTLTSVRDFSAVTAACMMMRKEVFDLLGGFDETFEIGFNDTDLCLRARAKGFKVLYDGRTMLVHHESLTRLKTKQIRHPEDDQRLRERWFHYFVEGDPFYNPNLDPEATDHALRSDAGCKRAGSARVIRIADGATAESKAAASAEIFRAGSRDFAGNCNSTSIEHALCPRTRT